MVMRTTTEVPDQLPPPPTGPNEGLAYTRPIRKKLEEGGLFPTIELVVGDFLFPEPFADNAVLPVAEMLAILENQPVFSAIDEKTGVQEVWATAKYEFKAVIMPDGRKMWKRFPLAPKK